MGGRSGGSWGGQNSRASLGQLCSSLGASWWGEEGPEDPLDASLECPGKTGPRGGRQLALAPVVELLSALRAVS